MACQRGSNTCDRSRLTSHFPFLITKRAYVHPHIIQCIKRISCKKSKWQIHGTTGKLLDYKMLESSKLIPPSWPGEVKKNEASRIQEFSITGLAVVSSRLVRSTSTNSTFFVFFRPLCQKEYTVYDCNHTH